MTVRLVLVLLILLPAVGWADEIQDRIDRFELLNDCRPVDLLVTWRTSGPGEIDLTEDDIRTAARSRLQGARLFDETSYPSLNVIVHVVHLGFNIRVQFLKRVFDAESGESFLAETWGSSITGTHGRDGGYVLSRLSRQVDKFIDEYLRVNAEACVWR